MNGYSKLAASIVTSSIWTESDTTRIVWITMIAIADQHGEVNASIPGLARIAGVSVPACESALATFLAPDPYSRTKDDDGRRIEEIEGGWWMINHGKYRELATGADRSNLNAARQKRYREKKARNEGVTPLRDTVTPLRDTVTRNAEVTPICQAEAEAEAEAEAKKKDIYSPESRVALHFLNEKSGKRFRECESSLSPINARLKEQGVDIAGVKQMIERQCQKWKGTAMEEYLRPATLFGKEKFDGYYAAKDQPILTNDKPEKPKHHFLI